MDFFDIRYDIKKLALVNYICDLANFMSVQEGDCNGILRLLLNTVYYIQNKDFDPKVKPVYELRLMCESGFSPNLTSCQRCGNSENLYYFSTEGGAVECEKCHKSPNASPGTLAAMHYICTSPLKSIFSFKAEEDVLHQLTVLAEQYVLHQTENVPKSLIYLKSI